MNNWQPDSDWEHREDANWMKGIPEDWPLSESNDSDVSINSSKCPPITMHMREWENKTAAVLDAYNDGKLTKAKMEFRLKELNKVKIK